MKSILMRVAFFLPFIMMCLGSVASFAEDPLIKIVTRNGPGARDYDFLVPKSELLKLQGTFFWNKLVFEKLGEKVGSPTDLLFDHSVADHDQPEVIPEMIYVYVDYDSMRYILDYLANSSFDQKTDKKRVYNIAQNVRDLQMLICAADYCGVTPFLDLLKKYEKKTQPKTKKIEVRVFSKVIEKYRISPFDAKDLNEIIRNVHVERENCVIFDSVSVQFFLKDKLIREETIDGSMGSEIYTSCFAIDDRLLRGNTMLMYPKDAVLNEFLFTQPAVKKVIQSFIEEFALKNYQLIKRKKNTYTFRRYSK
jgi:hypothetical protein